MAAGHTRDGVGATEEGYAGSATLPSWMLFKSSCAGFVHEAHICRFRTQLLSMRVHLKRTCVHDPQANMMNATGCVCAGLEDGVHVLEKLISTALTV